MFNYNDLSDVDFEYLCQDIMSKKLNTKLHRFAPGADGGIDLVDDIKNKNIVVQVKHYFHSTYSDLKKSLKKEITKVKKINPKEYYICCSKQITINNISEIYNMFSDYMNSEKNIITLSEIEDFLQLNKNFEIVRKHYKLWLCSESVLEEITNKDVYIDSEVLLEETREKSKYFVQTQFYNKALEILTSQRCLFLIGLPGVGKTITSKMLVMHFALNGYTVRYTTNGTDLCELKKSLSFDPDKKEIILLDDCLGQCYFNMKETQENEIITLIRYVHLKKNKVILLNSRVTIFNEAKINSIDMLNTVNKDQLNIQILDMTYITELEKAKILYNHLYFNNVPSKYIYSIKENKNYNRVINHKNYNPRIVEFISMKTNYEEINSADYFDFILSCLANPQKIWENEYYKRLKQIDRILLNTLFSLTETSIEEKLLKNSFNYRLSLKVDKEIDNTVNNFDLSLQRLSESFIHIISDSGVKKIGVLNPSVNDFLLNTIKNNSPEMQNITKSIITFEQANKIFRNKSNKFLLNKIIDHSIENFYFKNQKIKNGFILFKMLENNILDKHYLSYILRFIEDINSYSFRFFYFQTTSLITIFKMLFSERIYAYYNISELITEDFIRKCIVKGDLEDIVDLIKLVENHFNELNISRENFEYICYDNLCNAMEEFGDVDASEWVDDLNLSDYINSDDINALELEKDIENKVEEYIEHIVTELPKNIYNLIKGEKNYINVRNCEEVLESLLAGDSGHHDHDDFEDKEQDKEENLDEIDTIFK